MPTYKIAVESTIVTDHTITISDDVIESMDMAEREAIKLAQKEVPGADDHQVAEIEEVE